MLIPEFFKYNSLVSVPLFAIIYILLVKKIPEFSPLKYTISKSINFLNNPLHATIFRLNFIIKALLDFGFAVFLIQYFRISFESLISLALIFSAFLFGSLAYFTEGKYTVIHHLIIYSSGVLWAIGQISTARLVGDSPFILFTYIAILVPVIIGFSFLFAKKTNVYVQTTCISIWYLWLIVFVFRYL